MSFPLARFLVNISGDSLSLCSLWGICIIYRLLLCIFTEYRWKISCDSYTSCATMVNLSILTDVEILPAWPELKSQWEGREELELFRELQWSIWGMRPITLPPLEPFGSVITGAVAIKVHHVQNIAFGLIIWHRIFIVRAEHIQVVIDADVDVVVASLESEITRRVQM